VRILRQPASSARTRATAGAVTMAVAVVTAAVLAFTVVGTSGWTPALAVPVRTGAQTRPAMTAVRVAGLALARGRVLTLAGKPVSGEEVELLTWPAAALAASRRPARQQIIATAVTGADGRFLLVPRKAGPLLRAAAAAHGPVTLEVVSVGGGGGLASFTFSRVVRADGGRLQASPVRHPGRDAAPAWAQLRVRAPAGWAAAASACTVQVTARYGPQWTTVGQAFANVRGAQVTFAYGRGQLTELGVASSTYGRPGTYIPAGTLTVAATAAQHYPARSGPVRALYQTRFRFAKLEQTCAPPAAGLAPAHRFLVAATGFAGGARIAATPKPPRALFCVPFSAGSAYTLFGTTAVTWSTGVTIRRARVSLSAQTGYAHTASVTFRFTRALQLCGTAGLPGTHPGELVARSAG
jgi:hypothetical protein